jgi:addiction module RelE/StbE family toxin
VGEVRWTLRSQQDVRAIRDFIAVDNPLAASRIALRIVRATERLGEFALLGHIVPERQADGVRELVVRPYRIAYRVVDEDIEILKVYHGARLTT